MEIPGEISLLCRLCLANDEVNVPIFGEQSDIRQISLKISSCLPVKIAADDLLPKNICEGCSDKLELLYTFSKTSQEAEKKLLVWVEQVSVNNASEAITAVAKQIVDSTEVKEESDEGHKVNVKKSFDELVEDAEEKEPESEAPPPKRARRTAAVKAQISISQESEDEDDVDMVEPLTKVEDESEVSDSESVEPHSSFVDVPGTSADEQQPGPSGVQKDGADAPKTKKRKKPKPHSQLQKMLRQNLIKASAELDKQDHKLRFTCEVCDYTAEHSLDFALHSKLHTEKYYCQYCPYKSTKEKNIAKHIKKHGAAAEKLQCALCLKTFPDKFQAEEHKNFHSGEMPFSCEMCGKHFMFSWLLNAHNRFLHRGVTKEDDHYTCLLCKLTFGTKSGLKKHQTRKHEPKVPTLCDICGKSLSSAETLKYHKRTHTGYKPHACTVCGKSFLKKGLLVEHERVHTGEKPFTCLVCSKGFSQRGPLKIHLRIHTGERPFVCRLCGKACICKSVLDTHLKRCSENLV